MFNKIDERHQEQAMQSYSMEPMEGRIMMASDYLRPDGAEPTTTMIGSTVTFTYTVNNPAPTTGILIGMLLPAVQKMRS